MIIGIDIGGTTSKIGLVQGDGIIARTRISTTGHADEHAFADAIAAEVQRLATGNRLPITAIGIGAPNGNQLTGIIDKAPNLPWKNDVPLARMLSERSKVPCTLGNDANAAALGEWRYGAGKGFTDLLVVTLGTGVGSGLIVQGRLLLGVFGNAGELGHTTLIMDGRPCTCGRRGCLEAYVSIRGIRQTYTELADHTELLKEEGVKPIADAAMRGDDAAVQTFRHTARWLAVALANTVAITTPQRIILFGGIARNGDVLMEPLKRAFNDALLNIYEGKVELMPSALPEDDAGILGAAALATR